MNINRKNYEVYFIDYFDGKLKPAETADLLLFLEQNPDLKEEFEDFENLNLPAEEISYPKKDLLKKKPVQNTAAITAANYEDYFIAWHEGDLTDAEHSALQEFLSVNPDLQKDFELYSSLKLKADTDITYPKKQQLRKKNPIFSLFNIYSSAVAASILVLIGTWFFFSNEKQTIRTGEPAAVATMNTLESPDRLSTALVAEMTQLTERKEVFQISNPEIRIEKTEIFRMESLAMQETIENNTIDAYMPRLIYKRFDPATDLQELYAEAPEKEKTLAGKVIANAANSLASVFTQNVEELPLDKVKNFNIWDVAEAGIAGYNALADREVVMFREVDKNGRLVSVAILGENVDYRREFR